MAYADVAALRARLGAIYDAIYDQAGVGSNLDAAALAAIADAAAAEDLADAAAEIDGVISKRYQIPVTAQESLALLKGWNLTLAEERSYSRAAGSDFAEKVKSRVAIVRKYLVDAAAGIFKLPGAAENESRAVSVVSAASPIFRRDQLKDY